MGFCTAMKIECDRGEDIGRLVETIVSIYEVLIIITKLNQDEIQKDSEKNRILNFYLMENSRITKVPVGIKKSLIFN